MIKLNVGCNDVIFEGWTNMDLHPHVGAIQHDARQPFPYGDNSIDFMFSEHFIEHLNETESLVYLKECHRILKPGAVVRTSTFCIDEIMRNCVTDLKWDEYKKTLLGGRFSHLARTQFFNLAVHEAGIHKYMWNNDELIRYLEVAGFSNFNTPLKRESTYIELQALEWRDNSNCIVEAIK